MKGLFTILTVILVFNYSLIAQDGASYTKHSTVDFDTRIENYEIKLPQATGDIADIELQVLSNLNTGKSLKSITRDYYQTNNIAKYDTLFKRVPGKYVSYAPKGSDTFSLTIPPLEANKFYRLKITYVNDKDNIYSAFLQMHKEGKEDYTTARKKWMAMLDNISLKNAPANFFYLPSLSELKKYHQQLDSFNLNALTQTERLRLKAETLQVFEILQFEEPTFNAILVYAKSIKAKSLSSLSYIEQRDFLNNFKGKIDYVNTFKFYEDNLKPSLDINDDLVNQFDDFMSLVVTKLKEENDKYLTDGLFGETVKPNYLKNYSLIYFKESHQLSTYTKTFETSYKRRLVPDFGLLTYLPESGASLRGSPYVGVNISFKPVNKNVRMELSQLSTSQRLSAHLGVTINSIAEENKRENFFKNNSLTFGLGYKVFTHATRINIGGILYQKLDPFNGDKSIGVYPYLALSVDLEIRKWLEGLTPSITGNLTN